ncbi:MAG: hypothetical protein ABI441_18345 [Flavobacterium sp.]
MESLNTVENKKEFSLAALMSKGNNYLGFCVFAYGFYALLLLMESIDFAELLHSPPEGFHATYDTADVLFYIIDFVVCSILALLFFTMKSSNSKKIVSVVISVAAITFLRIFLVYYLYIYKVSPHHIVPFIYKEANFFSNFYRFVFLFLQIFSGILCVWFWIKINKKSKLVSVSNRNIT